MSNSMPAECEIVIFLKIQVTWGVKSYPLMNSYRCFERSYLFLTSGSGTNFLNCLTLKGTTILPKVGLHYSTLTDFSNNHNSFIFRVKLSKSSNYSLCLYSLNVNVKALRLVSWLIATDMSEVRIGSISIVNHAKLDPEDWESRFSEMSLSICKETRR